MTDPAPAVLEHSPHELLDSRYIRVGKPEEVERAGTIAARRLSQPPAAVFVYGHNRSAYLLTGDRVTHIVQVAGENGSEIIFTGANQPGYWLKLIGGQLWLLDAAPELGRDWRQFLNDAATAYPVPPPKVPYGLVHDGQIIGLAFAHKELEQLPGHQYWAELYVLEDLDRPELFAPTEEPAAFWQRFWDATQDGQLVRLGEQLQQQPGKITFTWDGTLARITFEYAARESPVLAPDGRCYVQWLPYEQTPCASGRPEYGRRMQESLRYWFRT